MPKFEFPKEYFEEENDEKNRLNKLGEKKKFISAEDLPSDGLTPEEIAIIEEARSKEGGAENESDNANPEDVYANLLKEPEEFYKPEIKRDLNEEMSDWKKLEGKAEKNLPKGVLEKPSFNTTLREQSPKERSFSLNRKIFKTLGKSKRNQGRKPEYKDKRPVGIPSEPLAE